MKKHLLISLSTLAAVACSSSSTPDAGPTDAGFTNVTFSAAIHPAAAAALTAAGATAPSLIGGGPYDAGYKLVIQGVSIVSTAAACPTPNTTPPICLQDLGSFAITSTPTYSLSIYNADIEAQAPLGVLAGLAPSLPDGGSPADSDGGLPQIPCSVAASAAGVAAALASGQATDYLVPSGSQVGGKAAPPVDGASVTAYGVPMSYVSLLNCAGQPTKTTRDSDQGVGLIYASNGTTAATGTAMSGVTFTVEGATASGPTYYTGGNYTAEATGAGASTDATGIATALNVTLTGEIPGTLKATDSNNDSFFLPGIATSANTVFNVLVYIP